MKQTIIVDVDAVIADTIDTMNYLYQRAYGPTAQRIEAPSDWAWAESPKDHRDFAMQCFDDIDYYRNMLPVVGAAQALRALRTKFNVHIMTARFCYNATEEELQLATLLWLARHGMTYDKISFAKDKLPVALSAYHINDIAYIIEDSGKTALTFAQAGIPALLVSFPYNRHFHHENIVRVPSLMSAAASTLLALEEMEAEGIAA